MTKIDPASASLTAPCAEFVAAYVEAQQSIGGRPLARSITESLAKTILRIADSDAATGERFWIVAGDAVVGRVTLRPKIDVHAPVTADHIGYEVFPAFRGQGLGHRAVALGIAEMHRRGISDLLMICEDDNAGAIKILEAAGGVLQTIVPHPDFPQRFIRRYRISPAS